MGSICARQQGGKIYYVYQESYRVKLNREDDGKKRGSGKSKVVTRAVYLGTAEKILKSIQEKKDPLRVEVREFGLVAAAYQTASEIGLHDVLMRHIPGDRSGVPQWVYFLASIINRLDHATSKARMSQWLAGTILPQLLGVDPNDMTGKNFWYAADDVFSERELKRLTQGRQPSDGPLLTELSDAFTTMEMELFARIDQIMGLSPSLICYDTTNFFTYIQPPKRSLLAQTCHSKDSKNHLNHVGLLMAVENTHKIPLLSQVYQANRHDSRLFSSILTDLVSALKKLCGADADLVIVLDKGNNSKENFSAMRGIVSWVGALVPSHHKDLIDLDLSRYLGFWKDLRYYRTTRTIMGMECAVVVTYNPATARKQTHSLHRGIEKLKNELRARWASYKKRPERVTAGILHMRQESDYGSCLTLSMQDGDLDVQENLSEIEIRKKRFGKSLIFSDMLGAETGYLVDTYHQRNCIEDDFKLLKDQTIIRFRPVRHWTDTKIRAYAFCCVVAMTIMRVMQWKAQCAGYPMSPHVLKEELSDIKEVAIAYSTTDLHKKISDRSTVQNKLWEAFKLEDVERHLYIH
jgi:transposase